jgi:motility quorum-sensing regulator/GCU-specific mRNA interferase toxin
MEKARPSYELLTVKTVLANPARLAITTSALIDAVDLGFDRAAIARTIGLLTRAMFYKSMTTYADHTLWQDVYHAPLAEGLVLYVKFQADLVTEFKLVSFKEK